MNQQQELLPIADSSKSGPSIRHRHYIDIDIHDTHAVLDHLMVDAVIRVINDIR